MHLCGKSRRSRNVPVTRVTHHAYLSFMNQPTKLQRHLDVIAYLVGRRLPVSVDELLERIPAYSSKWIDGSDQDREAVRRMFERDKDELRKAGIPLKTLKYTYDGEEREGYVIEKRDFYLPYLKLVGGEPKPPSGYRDRMRAAELEIRQTDAPLALEALRRVINVPGFPLQKEAKSAFRKLAFDLDADAFDKNSPVLIVDPVQASELTKHLKTLSDALLARKCVTFTYRGIYRGDETKRDVEGYALLFQSGHWYLVGHDRTRDDIRVFRVGRMSDVAANTRKPNTADYAIPADFKVDAYVGRKPWELGEDEQPVEVKVLFRFPLSLWAERNAYGTLVQKHDDGATTRSFSVRQLAPFARWLLSLQTEAEVLEPAQLRDEVKALAKRVHAAHGGAA
jgi:proteasome accessory factor B